MASASAKHAFTSRHALDPGLRKVARVLPRGYALYGGYKLQRGLMNLMGNAGRLRHIPVAAVNEHVTVRLHRPFGLPERAPAMLWIHGGAVYYAKDMDTLLHRERTGSGEQRAAWDSLPDGVFVVTDSGPAVVLGDQLAVWDGQDNIYRDKLSRPRTGTALLLTPRSTVDILRAGYPVQIAGY